MLRYYSFHSIPFLRSDRYLLWLSCLFIHSFIPAISIVPQCPFKSSTTQRRSRLQHRCCIGVSRRSAQATAGKVLAQGPYVTARTGVEPTTLRLKVIASTNAPSRPTSNKMDEY